MSYKITKVNKFAPDGVSAVEVECDDGNIRYKCQYCGKWLLKDETIEHESGDYCLSLREQGLDDAELAAIRSGKTVDELPKDEHGDFIKTAVLHKICLKNEIPVSAMVRSFGGDRGLNEPLHPLFRYVYFGKARYVSAWCATKEGLDFLRSVAKRAKKGEGESTAKALKAPVSVKPQTSALEEALTATVPSKKAAVKVSA